MSRESTLDEAIAKAKREGDWQLAEWLRAARGAESAARWYSDKLREAHRAERGLLDENKRLRDENKDLRDLVRCLYYAVLPADRGNYLFNVAELLVEANERRTKEDETR